ncbi:tetratricopeptide repeat protein [bacterium]|nr:tetratricopeptide repeat protein [bacterium]
MDSNIEKLLGLGITAHQSGNFKDAERHYQTVLQAEPNHPYANHNLGIIAISENKGSVSLAFFETALEADPSIELFWLSYIDALIKETEFDKAYQVLEQAKKQSIAIDQLNNLESQLASLSLEGNTNRPRPSKQKLTILLEHYQNGRSAEAERQALVLTQEFPDHHFGWKVLGVLYGQSDRNTEALIANRKAVALSFDDVEAHSNLGHTLKQLGRFAEAEASFRWVIALNSDYAQGYKDLAMILKKLDRLEESESSCRVAIAKQPSFAQAYNFLGGILREQDRLEESNTCYLQAVKLKPNYSSAYNNLGILLRGQGRLDEAEARYLQAIALNPQYAEAYSNLGNTLKDLGRLEEAEEILSKAIKLKPSLYQAHGNLANIYKELGRFDEAESFYNSAIVLGPDNADSHFNLAIFIMKMGRLEEAEQILIRATELKPSCLKSNNALLSLFYQCEKKIRFFDTLDYLISQDLVNSSIGSLTCRSALKYGEKKKNLFCEEPLKYTLHVDLASLYDFEEIFIQAAKIIQNEKGGYNKIQPLLVNGYQTSGNIFNFKHSVVEEIKKYICAEIEKYKAHFNDSEEGFLKKWPSDYSLYGWLVSMKSGGELHPHIHDQGWLSGAVYISVPPKNTVDSGNLVVSIAEEKDATDTRINEKKVINVETGSMVLFPASLTHYTIPFESEEERLVLAFDVRK